MSWAFVANRVYGAVITEAQRVVAEVVATREDVDSLMMDCFRWHSGPFGVIQGATEGWK
jgi:3-hydroxyacyl-CoA dehydrogenase